MTISGWILIFYAEAVAFIPENISFLLQSSAVTLL
jgi:hypothetical protein